MNKPQRGRPRSYDPDTALGSARDVFWTGGFSASSLDQLSEATEMNRPSLYAAFGDKEALYLKTLRRYRDESVAAMQGVLSGAKPLRVELGDLYAKSLDIYLRQDPARGCFLIGTACVEAVERPAVRKVLAESLRAFEGIIKRRLRTATGAGELASGADVEGLAAVASAVMYSMALRARAGDSTRELKKMSKGAVNLICGPTGDRS